MATTTIDRYDLDVNWNSAMDRGGTVVGKGLEITMDIEALRDSDSVDSEPRRQSWGSRPTVRGPVKKLDLAETPDNVRFEGKMPTLPGDYFFGM